MSSSKGDRAPMEAMRVYWLVQVDNNNPMRFDNQADALSEYEYHFAHIGKTITSCTIERQEEPI